MPWRRNCLARSGAEESGEQTSAHQVPHTGSDPNPVVVAPWVDSEET